MRRKYFGLAIAAFATLGPMQAWGGDREIAEQIISRLKTNRDSGALKDFTLDMKVDQGVVLFKGNVSQAEQKALVLDAAKGIDGVTNVVDEVTIAAAKAKQTEVAAAEATPAEAKPEEKVAEETASESKKFSFRKALAAQAQKVKPAAQTLQVVPGKILRASATEPNNDSEVVSAVVSALSQAQQQGRLRGFGVDVKSENGVLKLSGRAASPEQRDEIIRIAEGVPGVAGVREAIAVPSAAPNLPRLPEPPSLQEVSPGLTPVAVQPVSQPARQGAQAAVASGPVGRPAVAAPYRMQQGGRTQARPASVPMGVAGAPVPMAPHSAVGAPRYDSPNLPNYAWPGYAAYPNYAALTYPQQYSPSAWPYIGPFYPYPQVPLGWRKVSLEWDDGWWYLDFTDR